MRWSSMWPNYNHNLGWLHREWGQPVSFKRMHIIYIVLIYDICSTLFLSRENQRSSHRVVKTFRPGNQSIALSWLRFLSRWGILRFVGTAAYLTYPNIMSKKIWDVKELSKKMLSFNGLKGISSPETMAQNCEEDLVTTSLYPYIGGSIPKHSGVNGGSALDSISSGWWFQPLWKILVTWDDSSQYMET